MKKNKKPKYPGVVAEMARRGMDNKDLSDVIDTTPAVASTRLSGQTKFTLTEAFALSDFFGKSMDYLFRNKSA